MTLDEYTKELNRLLKEQQEIKLKMFELRLQFVTSMPENRLKGKKVRCFRRGEYVGDAYLADLKKVADYPSDDFFILTKIKEDGTMSPISAGYVGIDEIKEIRTAKK